MIVQWVGEIDPVEIADININVAKFNKAKIEHLVKEKNKYKLRSEPMDRENAKLKDKLKYAHDPLEASLQLNAMLLESQGDIAYWRIKVDMFQRKLEQRDRQTKVDVLGVVSELVKKRYQKTIVFADELWSIYGRTKKAFDEHIWLDGRLKVKIEELQTKDPLNAKLINRANKLSGLHQEYYE